MGGSTPAAFDSLKPAVQMWVSMSEVLGSASVKSSPLLMGRVGPQDGELPRTAHGGQGVVSPG